MAYFSDIAFIESDYFLWVKKTTNFIKRYIFKCVNNLYQLILLFKIEL